MEGGLCDFPVDWSEFQTWNIWKTGPRSFISTKFGEIMGSPPIVPQNHGGDPMISPNLVEIDLLGPVFAQTSFLGGPLHVQARGLKIRDSDAPTYSGER